MRYAVIDPGGAVVNVIEWDGVSPWTPEPGHTLRIHAEANIGGLFHDDDYVQPEQPEASP